jgi:hypothetical protein
MKKIDKNTLMDYLYGELPDGEAAQIARQLEEDPAAKLEYDQLLETRTRLSQLTDESVTELLVFSNTPVVARKRSWQKWAAAAAIFVLGLLTAAWLNIQVSFRNQELAIRFGEAPVTQPVPVAANPDPPVSQAKTTRLPDGQVSAKLPKPASADSLALQQMARLEQKLQRQMQELRKQQLALQTQSSGMTPEQVTNLIGDLQQENFETMQQLLLTANQQQQLYSQKMLAQLTDYLASQRKEDLQKINTVLNAIVQNTDQKQQQTDVVLNQVISRLNEKNTKQKN